MRIPSYPKPYEALNHEPTAFKRQEHVQPTNARWQRLQCLGSHVNPGRAILRFCPGGWNMDYMYAGFPRFQPFGIRLGETMDKPYLITKKNKNNGQALVHPYRDLRMLY